MNLKFCVKTAVIAVIVAVSALALGCGKKGVEIVPKTAEQLFAESNASVASVKSDYNLGTAFVAAEKNGKTYLITNKHVLERSGYPLCTDVELEFSGGQKAEAALIGFDSYHDIAVLVTDAADSVQPLLLSGNDGLNYGQSVYAIGNALGHGIGIFDGIVSVKEVFIEVSGGRTVPVVQTTAPINSGCSGGPVLDAFGNVVGVGTYQTGYDPSDKSDYNRRPVDGMSYFVSSLIAVQILRQAIAENPDGDVAPSELFKLDCIVTSDGEIRFSGLGFSGRIAENGITVTSSTLEYGTEKLSAGDVVTHIGGTEIAGKNAAFVMSALMNYLGSDMMPQIADWGDLITINFTRGGIRKSISRNGVYEKKY